MEITYNKIGKIYIPPGDHTEFTTSERETIIKYIRNTVICPTLSDVTDSTFREIIKKYIRWSWLIPKGQQDDPYLRGFCPSSTFPKRLAKLLNKDFYATVSTETIAQIGNILRGNKDLCERTIYYDFDKKINWKQGDFGDSGSCFWSGRNDTRIMLRKDPRIFAFRFFAATLMKNENIISYLNNPILYEEDNKKYFMTGYARAFIAKIDVNEEKENYILFNGYGQHLEEITRIFLKLLNNDSYSWKTIELLDSNVANGKVYIGKHQDVEFKGKGILVAKPVILDKIKSFDLQVNKKLIPYPPPEKVEILETEVDASSLGPPFAALVRPSTNLFAGYQRWQRAYTTATFSNEEGRRLAESFYDADMQLSS